MKFFLSGADTFAAEVWHIGSESGIRVHVATRTRILQDASGELRQDLPGLDHQRETFWASLLDARLHPMRACRVHNPRREGILVWGALRRRRGIREAGPLYGGGLTCR